MRRLLESICLMTAAGLCPAPILAAPAGLAQDACASAPAYQPADRSGPSRENVYSARGDELSMEEPAYEPVRPATSPAHSEEITALMNLHHLMAQEMSHPNRVQVSHARGSPLRDMLSLFDAMTGRQHHFSARLRALVYDTDEPPAPGAWSVKWDSARPPAANDPWQVIPADLMAPIHDTLQILHSLFDSPSRRHAHVVDDRGSDAAPAMAEPDTWAMLLAGVLGIGAMARVRLFA
jgi:hypothetical protein